MLARSSWETAACDGRTEGGVLGFPGRQCPSSGRAQGDRALGGRTWTARPPSFFLRRMHSEWLGERDFMWRLGM